MRCGFGLGPGRCIIGRGVGWRPSRRWARGPRLRRCRVKVPSFVRGAGHAYLGYDECPPVIRGISSMRAVWTNSLKLED